MEVQAEISDDCPLTKSVRRVFSFRAVGLTRPQIAAKLNRAESTIDKQNSAILAEMSKASGIEVKNLNEAVALACAEGWLTFKALCWMLIVVNLFQLSPIRINRTNARVAVQRGPSIMRLTKAPTSIRPA